MVVLCLLAVCGKVRLMNARDILKLQQLPPRKFGAAIARHVRRALKEGNCGAALYFLRLGKVPRILKSRTMATLRERVDRCYVQQRGGHV